MKMFNKILFFSSLIILLAAVKAFSADNVGRNVYSVYSENFNGVKIEFQAWTGQKDRQETPNLSSVDRAAFWPDRYSMASINVTESLYNEGEARIDGNKYWRINFSVTNNISSAWALVSFVNSSNAGVLRNMTAYNGGTIEFWMRSTSPQANRLRAGFVANWGNKIMSLSSFVPNGQWQKIVIPFSIYPDLSQINGPFIIMAEGGQLASTPDSIVVDIDNVVWKKAGGAGSFSADIKNISDNLPATDISWDESVLAAGWKAANQYIELDLDNLSNNNWGIQIYTKNTDSSASPQYTGTMAADMVSGLVADGDTTQMLPMCWRVTDKLLPYTGANVGDDYNKTLKIGTGNDGLYDLGSYEAGDSGANTYYCWFAMKDEAMFSLGNVDINYGTDYVKVWDKRGFHSAAGSVNYWGMSPGAMVNFMIKPRIYFGANFGSAVTPMTYQTNSIVIELYYE